MESYEKVLIPVEVIKGDYCCDERKTCIHFGMKKDQPTCDFRFDLKRHGQSNNILKPKQCKALKEV